MKQVFTKTILLAILITSFYSCQNRCTCQFEPKTILANDLSINTLSVEESLWDNYQIPKLAPDSYRLTIVPSYKCQKRVFSLINHPDSIYIETYILGDSTHSELIKPDLVMINKFQKAINESCFWIMESEPEPVLDGTTYLLEGRLSEENSCSKRVYHFVGRKQGDSTFWALCDQFLKMANTSLAEQNAINHLCWTK
ncbi:MAG: hypothetical protein KDD99_24760 [Bacteroidetes bacterium]|nr:hypothetical protein [Bacteroidota bacterium]